MEVNKRFDWLTSFFRSRWAQQQEYVVPPLIQPIIDVGCDWPLPYQTFRRQATLANGTNTYDLFPGPTEDPTAYGELHHHALYIWLNVGLSASLAVNAGIIDNHRAIEVGRLATSAAATSHFPLQGVEKDRRYIQYPYILRITVLAATAGQTIDIRGVRFDSRASDPICFP